MGGWPGDTQSPGFFYLRNIVMKTVAIIPAGGAGRRMGKGIPKQYLPLAGIPILVHTLQAFQRSPVIDEVFLAVSEGDIPEVRQAIVVKYGLSKVSLILPGGQERQDSVRNALQHVSDEHGIIVIHDAVRPFVSADLISRAVAAAREFGAITVGVPVKDTVKEATAEGWVKKTVTREGLWLTQTPQAFRRPIIVTAYQKAAAEGFYGTDDASLVERMEISVRMILGESDNIKVTTPEDLRLGDLIIRRASCERAG
jgi:2-C-methyl-D-erythritol 4-phosphate cytidylyltransferase